MEDLCCIRGAIELERLRQLRLGEWLFIIILTHAASGDFVKRQSVGSACAVGVIVPVIDIPVGVKLPSFAGKRPAKTPLPYACRGKGLM